MDIVSEYERLWRTGSTAPDVLGFIAGNLDAAPEQLLSVLHVDQKHRWRTEDPITVEEYLRRLTGLPEGVDWVLQLAVGEFEARQDTDRPLSAAEVSSRFPNLSETLQERIEKHSGGSEPAAQPTGVLASYSRLDPLCDEFDAAWRDDSQRPDLVEYVERMSPEFHGQLLEELLPIELWWRRKRGEQPNRTDYESRFAAHNALLNRLLDEPEEQLTTRLQQRQQRRSTTVTYITGQAVGVGQKGRYRLDRVLGEGGFGRVYLGYDEELRRQVAIKVPTKERFQNPVDAETYLSEARTVASLDHPHIVPVYDMGRTEDGSVYVISRFIDGRTLQDRIKSGDLSDRETAELIATVATALHFAHQRRLIHRDVKPANILIEDSTNTPFVADFGLAVREEDYLQQNALAGTPAYMSPEQARGEGHRLDGRSDVFALGVILYECLTRKKPFRGSSPLEVVSQVISSDPPAVRSLREAVAPELERICLKALSKRASDRYATAAAMAEDLRAWLAPHPAEQTAAKPTTIVPRGLRSFGPDDADFFLDLLPGPRNRDGLPESIAFWKQRIEETDPDETFSVGLIYGPSGCGKSSLVKAGLLPHLSPDVVAVYLEATPDETESRILRGIRKRLPDLSDDLTLVEAFTWLRREATQRIVVIIDQFEQRLHTHREERDSELVAALRQCDGGRLQAVVMVRDDFGMAVARFMDALDIPLIQGHNYATIDLFDVEHAEKVLVKFGQAYGKLPAQSGNLTNDEQSFIRSATFGLAEDGKVVSVRLALFAEMVKGKPWVSATLEEVGGTSGIGVNFLEETFSSRTANPKHRLHQQAAREVLKSLLPGIGSDIKGHMRSHNELLEASGYQDRPRDFADLLRILDGELRLITPTDPEGAQTESASDLSSKYYQLTHDYLVPSLREWLTRKQQETRTGRAELKLAERAGLWNAKRESRHLPSLAEWLRIRTLTDKSKWTEPQQKMMRTAKGVHLTRLTSVGLVVALITISGWWAWERSEQNRRELIAENAREREATRIEGLVGRLVAAAPEQLAPTISALNKNPDIATEYLLPLLELSPRIPGERQSQLHARIAMVGRDPALIEPLVDEILTGKLSYIAPICRQLPGWGETDEYDSLTAEFRANLHDENEDSQRRFRSALALALYEAWPDESSWSEEHLRFVAKQLTSFNPEFQPLLRDALRPISDKLLADLEHIFANSDATDGQRLSAANAFADYAANDIDKLTELLTVATEDQFAVLFSLVSANPSPSTVEQLSEVAAKLPSEHLGSVERIAFGQRRANAAVTLLRLGERETVLPVFDMGDDPEALTQFIFRCRPRDVGVAALLDCLQLVSDASPDRYPAHSRYALLLALGEFTLDEIPEARRDALLTQLSDWYGNDPSSGVHGASGWLLRHWGQTELARQIDQTPMPYSADREWFTLAVDVTPTALSEPEERESEQENVAAGSHGSPTQVDGPVNTGKLAVGKSTLSQTFYWTFVVIPKGIFEIGTSSDEKGREKDEVRHQVELTRSFAVLDREITLEELIAFSPLYSEFMLQFDAQPSDAGFGAHWYDSVAFCRWLSQQSGLSEDDQAYAHPDSLDDNVFLREPAPAASWAPRNWPMKLGKRGFRLPTEAEWEAASRCRTRTAYSFGSDPGLLGSYAWFTGNSGGRGHPPRKKRPNFRGLFDVHGNVMEWTHDWWDEVWQNEGVDGDNTKVATDPLGPLTGSLRTNRGGNWNADPAFLRSGSRHGGQPTTRIVGLGLRIALSLPSRESQEKEEQGDGGTEEQSEAATTVP